MCVYSTRSILPAQLVQHHQFCAPIEGPEESLPVKCTTVVPQWSLVLEQQVELRLIINHSGKS